jgi:hypothetical protein
MNQRITADQPPNTCLRRSKASVASSPCLLSTPGCRHVGGMILGEHAYAAVLVSLAQSIGRARLHANLDALAADKDPQKMLPGAPDDVARESGLKAALVAREDLRGRLSQHVRRPCVQHERASRLPAMRSAHARGERRTRAASAVGRSNRSTASRAPSPTRACAAPTALDCCHR